MEKTQWWAILTGIIMIAAGIIAFITPDATIKAIALIVGIGIIISGIVSIIGNLRHERTGMNNLNLILALFAIIFGIILVVNPEFAINVFIYIIGIWFIVDAVQRLAWAKVYKSISYNLYAAALILDVLLLVIGLLLILNPLVVWFPLSLIIGLALLIGGITYLVYGFAGRPKA